MKEEKKTCSSCSHAIPKVSGIECEQLRFENFDGDNWWYEENKALADEDNPPSPSGGSFPRTFIACPSKFGCIFHEEKQKS